jgi:hypothetical protein
MGSQAPPDAATRARSGRPQRVVARREDVRPGAGYAGRRLSASFVRRADVRPIGHADVRCPRVRCPGVRCSGVRTDRPALSAAMPPRGPHRAGPWDGSLPRAVPAGRMVRCAAVVRGRRGRLPAWGLTGRDGAGVAVGGSHEGRHQTWAAPSHAHRLRRRLAAWPTREQVQRQGAGRLAGEHENQQVLTSPPQVRPGQVAGVVPDHGRQGGGDHAPWSLGW